MLASLKDQIPIDKFVSFYVKCLIQNSNYEEIVASINYITTGQHSLEGLSKPKSSSSGTDSAPSPLSSKQELFQIPAVSVGEILGCVLDHDDWVVFRKLYQLFRENNSVDEQALKKLISVLVEKQQLDTLRFVISFALKDTQSFMNLKLSENQYKFIILSFVKSYIEVSSKLNEVGESNNKDEAGSPVKQPAEDASDDCGPVGEIQSVSDSDEFFEIVDEATIQKIIQDIAIHEKKDQK